MMSMFIEPLNYHPSLFILLSILLGISIGSFLTVLIYRLPTIIERANKRYNLFGPRSHCDHCYKQLKLIEIVPLFSFFMLRGKCSNCKKPIPKQYPLIEATTGTLTFLAALHFGPSMEFLGTSIFFGGLIALSWIDVRKKILPDSITLPLLWLGLSFNFFEIFITLQEAFLGCILGYLTLSMISKIYEILRGKVGMGQGDVKLFAAIGSWVGWKLLVAVIMIACLTAILKHIWDVIINKTPIEQPIAFGPYLAIGGMIGILWESYPKDILWFLHF